MKTFAYALRHLMRARAYTVINLLGLALSLACCIVLMRYIHRELTVDTHCVDRDNVYAVVELMEGGRFLGSVKHPFADSLYIDKHYIETASNVIVMPKDYVEAGHNRYSASVYAVDSFFLKLFRYGTVQGVQTLDTPRSALLTEGFARQVFGTENPVGQVLRYSNGQELTVAGVLAEPDNKTTFRFDVLVLSSMTRHWERMPIQFIRFTSGTDMAEMNRIGSVPRLINPTYPDDTRQFTFSFLPVREMYWESVARDDSALAFNYGVRGYLYMISGICLVLLFTGFINFLNLYLVSSIKRSREYGVKRVFGISRGGLFLQMWLENLLLVGAALFVAWMLVEVSAPWVERLFGYRFGYEAFDWQISLGILVLLPLLAAAYSYLKYSRMAPVEAVRSTIQGRSSIRMRMAFLFVQYVFCFLILLLSFYFNRQLSLLLRTEPGFRTEDIIQAKLIYESNDFAIYRDRSLMQARINRVKAFDQAMDACPHIESWVAEHERIIDPGYETTYVSESGQEATVLVRYVTPEFFKLFRIRLTEGSVPESGDQRTQHIVLNRSAMRALRLEGIENARVAEANDLRASREDPWDKVIAVAEDYYCGHVGEGVRPMMFVVGYNFGGDLYEIACAPGRVPDVLDYLRQKELEIYGSEDFEYSMLEDDVAALYDRDKQVAAIYTVFAFMAVVVACLGLFGLSLFDVRQRYREIGIRKVNGAGLKDICLLLTRKYVWLLGVAYVVSLPIAVWLIYRYTEGCIVKAPLGVGMFLLALLIVAVISLGTLVGQVRKAARINPAEVVKSE